jgi:hypothetical protein
MALIITTPVQGAYDQNIVEGGGLNVLAGLNNSDPDAAKILQPRPATFFAEGTSLGNEAVTLALLAPINLTALGVLFPASSCRLIKTKVWSRLAAAASCGYTERHFLVVGAATPTIPNAITVAAALAAVNEVKMPVAIPNNNSAGAPEYGVGVVIMDAVSTTNVIVGVQNILGTTFAATATAGMRWRLEVTVDPLVQIPVFA